MNKTRRQQPAESVPKLELLKARIKERIALPRPLTPTPPKPTAPHLA